ncbi:unnamed protein product [Adineta steineri]|uniref:Carrier domain-containing protein n=1 Tax=Adineta steineri TaxID=433720 RepID=A0A815I7I6_9BILA|nr:unnamed protein product [Adineta steineri]CAF1361741.1 unnamed protein product [Adineta steineri]
MSTMMEMSLLQKIQEEEMMPSPASSAIPAAGCSQGAASFAQERIWLDEKIHHDPSISPAMYNFVLPLIIKHGSMSIDRIHLAIVAVLEQHEILRTAIYFDKNRNMLVQAVQPVVNNVAYSFEITANDIQSPDEIADLLRNESIKHFAELEQGLVVRCHLVKVGSDDDTNKLYPQDLIIFIFHGIAFDYNSINPFLVAFTKAYNQMELDVESEMKSIVKTNDAALSLYTEQPWLHGNGIASHDMNLKMIHNQSSQTTYCIFECSADCYDEVTVSNIGRYFHNLLSHIFTENTKTIGFDPALEKIGNLSLLPMNVETLLNINESLRHFSEIKPASYTQHQIWHDEERRLHLGGLQLATHNMVFCYRLSADRTFQINKPIYELSLTLSNEQYLMQSLNNTQISFSSSPFICIHHEFVYQVMKHPQKLAVELDEQSLTYCELLYYVQVVSLTLLNEYHVFPGEIVCQCVERSLTMVIGMMGIEMAGGVYCPLSPRDPQHRLHALTQQTRSRLVLVHHLTKTKFNHDIALLGIDSILTNTETHSRIHVNRLSDVAVIPDNMAYIIFTSGSTGMPKPTQLRHRNFTRSIQSLVHVDIFNKNDIIVQMARCERCSVQLVELLESIINSDCSIWNLCGPAETTLQSLFHRVNSQIDAVTIPLGRPLPNYSCMIEDDFGQCLIVGKEGEILLRGIGIFAGYLGRDDLTARAFVEIDGEIFYRTGDLVRMDNNGLLHYLGRKDHQIKLHGQRIELGEIERCLLSITSISACVVMKWKDDYLVAYVQSSQINEGQLRQHCQSHLPPHMIPSFFIILDKLPLNQNGKIDRKLLPSPHYPSLTMPSVNELDTPVDQAEKSVYDIWCQVLEYNSRHISTTTNFFTTGGHSRLFIELYHRYQTIFAFDSRILSISPFLEQPTIQQHAKLLKTVTTDDIRREQWYTLHINRSMASFAQERIFLDEQIRFSNKHIFYNNFVALRVTEGILSINRVLQALQLVLTKHEILRTSLVFNNDDSTLQQYVTDNHKTFTFLDQQTFENDNELQNIIYQTVTNPDLFDLSSGRVFSCQVLQQQKTTHETVHTDFLEKSDILVLYFHHAAVDGTSIPILLNDFCNAYSNNMTVSLDEQSVQYIDYTVHERLMDMTTSRSFWYSQLDRFNLQRALKLPVDRQRSPAVQRSSLPSIAQISFDKELSMMFLNYASLHQITPFQLGLTAFYVFLFKLTHGETDLCIASINANRYRSELENMIGMFVSTLPYCVQLNSHWSFDELVKHVREKCLSILEHSHYPLQHILTDFRLNQLDVPFLEILFNFLPVSTNIDRYSIGVARLEQVSIKQADEISQFDFSTTFLYDLTSDDHKLSSPASFAQARICLDERIRFNPNNPQTAIFNMPFVYRLHSHHTLSVQHVRYALELIVTKHQSLRTSLHFDIQKNLLTQRVITHEDKNNNNMFSFIETTYATDKQLNMILYDEMRNPHLFDLAQGLVFRCHIIYYKQISSNHLLSHRDILIFNFHHALFDFPSMKVFLHDLNQAYTTSQLLYDDNNNLRYLDYAVIEQQMSMTGASMFWLDALHDCKLDQPLSLPFDRYRLSNEHRTGREISISFSFGQDLSHDFLIHASSNNISLEYLTFAIYFIFLFKLTHGQTDLCIAMNINNNRYRDELKSIIGLFENIIPLRCQLDPHWCFDQLLEHVQEITINSMKYSYFPVQRILNQHPHISKHAFLDTSLEFISYKSNNDSNAMMIGDAQLAPESFSFNMNEDERLIMKHPQKLAVELDEQSLTYCELLYYVQVVSLTLLNEYHVFPGEIVCQCVERSLTMVIGMMGIEMAGGVYCPLSPRDPQHRLHALTQQTRSRLVFVHHLTKAKFDDNIISLDIDSILIINDMDKKDLSSVILKDEEIAYIIFTSGSTGTPKAVQVRHKNFIDCINSLTYINSFNKDDTVVQMTRCSFDIHVQEILGTLLVGGTLIMLHPGGTIDFDYLSEVLQNKQITYLHTVPSFLHSFFIFIVQNKNINAVKHLRSLCSIGEAFVVHLIELIVKIGITNCIVWNLYGPAETTIVSTFYRVDLMGNTRSVSVGTSLSNYRCIIMNEYSELSITNQEGELCVGGAGVFAGYLGCDDLSAKALLQIDGQLFYRTGDLVTMDSDGLLHYQGRKDHQIKLHGQRIELGEIERCLLNITSISACVVMKWNNDHLVAYVQSSSHMNEEQLREHCQSHLPPHMIPSFFIILDKLPLNQNGKVDRKQLPSPHFSSKHLTNNIELVLPTNDIEISIHRIWCEIFKQNQISIDTNVFTIGGHSLLIMQLFHRYKIEFHLEANTLSISNLFQHPTIIHHAQLIQQFINTIHTLDDYPWSSLHIVRARASFAQERIYLDEQIRFSSNKATMKNMYVIPLLYRISSMNEHISITRLHHAFQSVITKHNILRTALYIDDTNNNITQQCLDANIILDGDIKSYGFTIVNIHNDDHRHMNESIEEILNQADLFDLSKGHVIRFHILRHYHQSQDNSSRESDDLLTENDHIMISIHHAMFDGASTSIFLRDLSLAYQSHDSLSMDENALNYINYSVHEHVMDMSLSREFWHSQLEEYNIECSLSLPVDRQRSSTNQQRSGLASTAEITFDNELCTSFLNYASSHHLTLFQLGLSIFYVFLFKLTHGETDLCISSINANRYRSELVKMIGMFVSTLPYRLEIDCHWSFDEVVKHVREKCLSILEHSHYPLQHILGDNRSSQSNVSFLETMFDFITRAEDVSRLRLNGVNLEQVSLNESYEMAKFDFSLTFVYNSSSDDNQLSFSFVCSHDLFQSSTISQMARRFQCMFEQLFQTQSSNIPVMNVSSSINKVCLILPEETEETELVVFHRLKSIVNEGMII